jgi:DNA polymerase I-like protein with 3'-5' exonuclease and polymerase domains
MSDERIAALRAICPPINRNQLPPFALGRATIDLEWERDRPEILKCIGIGNQREVFQLWWQELSEGDRELARLHLFEYMMDIPVVYHNAIADLRVLRMHGFNVSPGMHRQLDDTMLADAAYFAEEDHDLGDIGVRVVGMPEWKDLSESHPELYNAMDLVAPMRIIERFERELWPADPRAESIYRTQSLPLLPHILEGEERGLAVDGAVAYELKDKFDRKCAEALKLGQAYLGYPINLGSPDQLAHAFYAVEKFPAQWAKHQDWDADPKVTTNKDALAELRKLHGTEWDEEVEPTLELADAAIEAGGNPLLEARYLYYGAQQARSHYVDPCLIWEKDNVVGVLDRIYPETRIHAQASGRHSIVKPPLPQIKGDNRRLFRPDPGWPFFEFDWSNIETWLLGYLAGDELILKAKADNWDTHTVNLCDLMGVSHPVDRTKAVHTCDCINCTSWRQAMKWQGADDIRRTFSKRAIFRTHYRGNPDGMGDIPGAKALGMDGARMTAAVNRYLDLHHWIREFWKSIEHDVDTAGVVYTWDGRPRRLTAKGVNARYREASNHPLQGGVAGIYNQTYLTIKRLLPEARFITGAYDAQTWAFPAELYDVYSQVALNVAQRHYTINGRDAFFPASVKKRRDAYWS